MKKLFKIEKNRPLKNVVMLVLRQIAMTTVFGLPAIIFFISMPAINGANPTFSWILYAIFGIITVTATIFFVLKWEDYMCKNIAHYTKLETYLFSIAVSLAISVTVYTTIEHISISLHLDLVFAALLLSTLSIATILVYMHLANKHVWKATRETHDFHLMPIAILILPVIFGREDAFFDMDIFMYAHLIWWVLSSTWQGYILKKAE